MGLRLALHGCTLSTRSSAASLPPPRYPAPGRMLKAQPQHWAAGFLIVSTRLSFSPPASAGCDPHGPHQRRQPERVRLAAPAVAAAAKRGALAVQAPAVVTAQDAQQRGAAARAAARAATPRLGVGIRARARPWRARLNEPVQAREGGCAQRRPSGVARLRSLTLSNSAGGVKVAAAGRCRTWPCGRSGGKAGKWVRGLAGGASVSAGAELDASQPNT